MKSLRLIAELLFGLVCGILLGSLIGWTVAKILVSM